MSGAVRAADRRRDVAALGGGFVVAGVLIGIWSMTRYSFYRRAARHAEENSP